MKTHHSNRAQRRRERHLLRVYGMTQDDFDLLLGRQRGKCAVCRTDTPGGVGDFHIDHCHETGAIRGLLCANCNQGLGKLKDSPQMLTSALRYLAKHGRALTTEEVLRFAAEYPAAKLH